MNVGRDEYDASVDPYAKRTFKFYVVEGRDDFATFLEDFRGLERSEPITRRPLKNEDLVNLDVYYQDIRIRLKIKADDLYLIGFCLCKKTGSLYETSLHELRDPKKDKNALLKGAVPMGVDFRYPDFKIKEKSYLFGYPLIIKAIKTLSKEPLEPKGSKMKASLVYFMLLFCEAARFRWVGEDFSELIKGDKLIEIDEKYTDQILKWSQISNNAREVKAGSTLEDEEEKMRVVARDTDLFYDMGTKGVAAEQFVAMKCLEAKDFKEGKVVFKRNRGVPQDDGEEAGSSSGSRSRKRR